MATTLLDQLVASTEQRFEERYGQPPRWVVAAPGRVNLIGEHVDYNDGFVLPMAIDRYCVMAAGESSSRGNSEFFSVATEESVAVSLEPPLQHATAGHWSNYVAGVVCGCLQRGMRPPRFQAVIESSVPLGGGLSSSAALEVATATLMEAITCMPLDPIEKALLCQRAEHEYAGVPCGIMDQFASAMCRADHLMLLDCRSQHVEHIPLDDPQITILIVNTHVKHELGGSEYARRHAECESAARNLGIDSLRDITCEALERRERLLDPVEFRRARHVVAEIERTTEAALAIKARNWEHVGQMMYTSHDSLRDDFEVSCPELDLLVELAEAIGPEGGVIGSRMTGGGFGGCTVSLVETQKVERVAQQLAKAYRLETGIEPSILTSRPAKGAHIISSP